MLEYYDSDKRYPAYFFGAKVNGQVEHCYPLNGNYVNPEVSGVLGILDWYHTAIRSVELFGPTYFRPVISAAAQ